MPCDMCGADTELVLVEIEGARLHVCGSCGQFGKVLGKVRPLAPVRKIRISRPKPQKPAVPEWVLVKDFAARIRRKRESLDLKQKEMGQRLAEKESLLHKIETGSFKPGIDLARKIERILGITLLEKTEPIETTLPKAKGEAPTLGDFVKIRKK